MALGHRRLALINGETTVNDRAKARRAGVHKAIADFGKGARLTHEVEAPYLIDAGGTALAEILAQPDVPTAVLCANDALAAGAMVEARARGLRLPEDMSFVGFDDIGVARVVSPPLATVRVPQIEMGRHAARLLRAKIAGQTGLFSTVLETEFIHRGSLTAPSKA
jgi:LacI family transcriptional regulator